MFVSIFNLYLFVSYLIRCFRNAGSSDNLWRLWWFRYMFWMQWWRICSEKTVRRKCWKGKNGSKEYGHSIYSRVRTSHIFQCLCQYALFSCRKLFWAFIFKIHVYFIHQNMYGCWKWKQALKKMMAKCGLSLKITSFYFQTHIVFSLLFFKYHFRYIFLWR